MEESPCRHQRQPLFSTEISDPRYPRCDRSAGTALWSPSGKRIGARSLPPRGIAEPPSRTPIRRNAGGVLPLARADRWGIPWSGIAAHDGCDRSPRPAVDPAAPNPANSAAELGLVRSRQRQISAVPAGTCSGSEGSRNGPGLPAALDGLEGRDWRYPSSSNPANRPCD